MQDFSAEHRGVKSSLLRRRRTLRKIRRVQRWSSASGFAVCLYVIAALLDAFALLFVLIQAVTVLLLGTTLYYVLPIAAGFLAYVAAGLCATGFAHEVVRKARKHWRSPWRIAGTVALGATVMAVSRWASGLLIASATGADSSYFPRTAWLLAVAIAPTLWWMLAMATLFVTSMLLLLYYLLIIDIVLWVRRSWYRVRNHPAWRLATGMPKSAHPEPPRQRRAERVATELGRSVGAVALLGAVILVPGSILDRSSTLLDEYAGNVLVYADYLPANEECESHDPNEWVKPVGGGKASVATPDESGGYVFETRLCNPKEPPSA